MRIITYLTMVFMLAACGSGSTADDSEKPADGEADKVSEAGRILPKPHATLLQVPVVFHLLTNDAMPEVSDEKLISQITMSNAHFQAQNSTELDTVPRVYWPYIGHAGIELVLAKTDPNGAPTTGITRTELDVSPYSNGGECDYCATGTAKQWDSQRYINIWIGDSSDRHGGIALPGYSSSEEGVDAPETWGVHMDYRTIGNLAPLGEQYTMGKTATHEIGHYLGLTGHILAGSEGTHRFLSCDGQSSTSCLNSELTMSFMHTMVRDEVLKMFSISQVHVMRTQLETGRLKDAIIRVPTTQ